MTKGVALVTGGMGGLGTAICKALAKDGFTVAANCLPDFAPKDEWLASTRAEGFDFQVAEADARLARVLWNDPATGVMRHADAGYEDAVRCAREQRLNLPMIANASA